MMELVDSLLPFFVAVFATGVLLAAMIPVLRAVCLDVPTARSSHVIAVPRGGGLAVAIVLGLSIVWTAAQSSEWRLMPLLTAMSGLALISLWDDLSGHVPAPIRLGCHALAGWIVVSSYGTYFSIDVPWLGPEFAIAVSGGLSVVLLMSAINTFNFADGIDGYLATNAIVGNITLLTLVGAPSRLPFPIVICGACLAFLYFNWSPARVFLGDVGSTVLGFGTLAVILLAPAEQRVELLAAVMLWNWLVWGDVIWTLCVRIGRGEKFWLPHRQHLYQRTARLLSRHSAAVLLMMAVQLPVAGLVTIVFTQSSSVWIRSAAVLLPAVLIPLLSVLLGRLESPVQLEDAAGVQCGQAIAAGKSQIPGPRHATDASHGHAAQSMSGSVN